MSNFSRRMRFGGLIVYLAISSTGCAILQPSPLVQAQKSALEERERASQASPIETGLRSPDERVVEGDRFRAQGRSDQAMLSYLAAVRMDPTSPKPKERIGFIHLASDVDRAEAIFDRLVEEDASNSIAWRGLGLARMAHGDLAAAVEALARAVEIQPGSAGARYALAAALGLMGRPSEALEHALEAEALRPTDAHVANVVGMSRLLLDDHVLAEESFRRAVRLAPGFPSFVNNLGLSLGLQGRFEEAYGVFRHAGDEQLALNNMGYVYFLKGEYEKAIEYYERALAAPGEQDLMILKNLNVAISGRDGDQRIAAGG